MACCLMAPSHYQNHCWLWIIGIHPSTSSKKIIDKITNQIYVYRDSFHICQGAIHYSNNMMIPHWWNPYQCIVTSWKTSMVDIDINTNGFNMCEKSSWLDWHLSHTFINLHANPTWIRCLLSETNQLKITQKTRHLYQYKHLQLSVFEKYISKSLKNFRTSMLPPQGSSM